MQKRLIKNCQYSVTAEGHTLVCDTYILINDEGALSIHETLFLCDTAKYEAINSIRSYACDLLSFTKMAQHFGGWRKIRPQQMLAYLHGDLFQKRGLSHATLTRHIETLKKFYGWLQKKGYIDSAPNFDWRASQLYARREFSNVLNYNHQYKFKNLYIDDQTFSKLLTGIESKNTFIVHRNEIALQLGYSCGLRASELLTMQAEFIAEAIRFGLEDNLGLYAAVKIEILGKGNKYREIFLPAWLAEKVYTYIKRYRNILSKCNRIFCTAKGVAIRNPKFGSTLFSRACRSAKILRYETQGYHRLRKTFGTNLVANCYELGRDPWVEVPRRMGHSNPETTKRYIQFDALLNKRSGILSSLAMPNAWYGDVCEG